MRLLLLIAVLGWTMAAEAATRTFYVSYAAGNDANNGLTTGTPWKRNPFMVGFSGTYSHQVGDHFIHRGGDTWPVTCFRMDVPSGAAGNPDVYGSDQTWFTGGSWTRPLFDFQNTLINGGANSDGCAIKLNGVSNVTFDGIEMARLKAVPGAYGPMMLCLLGANDYIIVTNCVLHDWSFTSMGDGQDSNGVGAVGHLADPPTGGHVQVTHCLIHQDNTGGQYDGVATRNIDIVDNTEIRNTTQGVLGGGLIIHDCHIWNMKNGTDTTFHCNAIEVFQPATIYNVLMHDCQPRVSPINLVPTWSSGPSGAGTNYIYNMTMWNLGQPPITLDPTSGAANQKVYLWNNTISDAGYCMRSFSGFGYIESRNNHLISSQPTGVDFPGVGTYVQSNNRVETAASAGTFGYTIANQFQPSGTGSPTVDQGTTIGYFSTDRLGVIRPQFSAWDIGAYEFSSGGTSPGMFSWTATSYSGNQGSQIIFSINRSGGSLGTVTIQVASSDGSAVNGHDYTAINQTLTWADGATGVRSFAVNTLASGDTATTNRTFTVTMSSPTGGATIVGTVTVTGTIVMNRPAGTVQLAASAYSTTETNAIVTLVVTRLNGSAGSLPVNYTTADITALAGHDYYATNGTITFADGDTANKNLNVSLKNSGDTATTNRTFRVTLSGGNLGTPVSAIVTIAMNPPLPIGNIQVGASTYTVALNGTNVAISVTRYGGSSGAVGVSYTTGGGSAVPGTDYLVRSGVLTWANGVTTSQVVNVPIIFPHGTNASNRTFSFTLSSPTGGAGLGVSVATVIIIENTPVQMLGGVVTLGAPNYTVNETGGSLTIPITRSGGTNLAVNVNFSTVNGSAVGGFDFVATSGTKSWTANQNTTQNVVITINDTGTGGAPRVFGFQLTGLTAGATYNYQAAQISIIMDHVFPITIKAAVGIGGSLTVGGSVTLGGK